jgi:hypothetical protein
MGAPKVPAKSVALDSRCWVSKKKKLGVPQGPSNDPNFSDGRQRNKDKEMALGQL